MSQQEAVTLDEVVDGIVSSNTFDGYVGEILNYLSWCYDHETDLLTDYGKSVVMNLKIRREDESLRAFKIRRKKDLKVLLHSCCDHAIIEVEHLQPKRYMEYILQLRHSSNGHYLSKSAYGNRRSALFHLVRLHNNIGFDNLFRIELNNLFRGFFRKLAKHCSIRSRSAGHRSAGEAGNEAIDSIEGQLVGQWNNDDAKVPLSVALLKSVCGWLLGYGTCDGVFAHCYLLLTWNLSCRSSNTACLKFEEINWSTKFDSFQIRFAHSKTDQTGEEAKYPRHIYANPVSPIVCPVLALSIYFSTCFNAQHVGRHSFLFPGGNQHSRFSKILMKVLKDHVVEVKNLGFNVSDLGTHSIRKGASSYLVSLPGGPPAAATSLRGGWSMGDVKDRYWKYMEAGDEYVGRCLALMPVLSTGLASSPPYFSSSIDTEPDNSWIENVRLLQFPVVGLIDGFRLLSRMCLASLLYHHKWLEDNLSTNHVVCLSSYALRSKEVLEKIDSSPSFLVVTYPWNDDIHAFSGVPPHASLLQELSVVKENTKVLIDSFIDRVKDALTQYGVNSDRLTQNQLQNILENFWLELRSEISKIERLGTIGNDSLERVETGKGYTPHVYGGSMHRVPIDWRFPRCGVQDLWRQWWIGDNIRQIPPLRFLESKDVKHLDKLPLEKEELHGRNGAHKENRREAVKVLSDMRCVMNYLTRRLESIGEFARVITASSVDRMFWKASDSLFMAERDGQKQWQTIVKVVRKKKRQILE